MYLGLIDAVNKYAIGWENAVFLRVLIGLVGLVILLLTGRAVAKRDCTVLAAILWLILSVILMVFSMYPTEFIGLVISTEYMTRIRFIGGGISLLVLLVTLESIRRTHLQERYALLWVTTALVILVCTFFPDAVALFRAVTGMEYSTAIVSVAFTFLVLVAFHFSISMSAILSKHAKVAQRVAILEARLKDLEDRVGTTDLSFEKSKPDPDNMTSKPKA
jgi:hypothetical protein